MAPSGKGKREAKRQRREAALEARREERQRQEVRRRRRSLAVYGAIALIVVLGGGLLAWSVVRPRAGAPAATGAPTTGVPGAASTPGPSVRDIPDQGRAHVALGQPHPAYNSNPPTSGWHTPQTAPWGVHRTEIPDEVLVHNLEHGGIWISYKDPNDAALIGQLEALVSRYRSKVILTPRPANDARIALAAWTKLLGLDAYDEGRIVEFINAFRNKGPEQVPD